MVGENKPSISPSTTISTTASTIPSTKDKQRAQLSAQVAARTALFEKIEQQQAPAPKGGKAKKAAPKKTGNAWSAWSGAIVERVTPIIKGAVYADDTRWESKKGAEDGCKRAGFQLRAAGWLKREYELDDGKGGYLEVDDDKLIEAIEHLLDNPFDKSATAKARGGMSVTELKKAGLKIAKPSAAKPVAKPAPVAEPESESEAEEAPAPKPAKKSPAPVKKPVAEPEPESEAEEAPAPAPKPEAESEAEEAPAPAPKPAKKSVAPAPAPAKSAVLAAAAEVAEEAAAELEEPTSEELKEAGLLKFKHPKTREWYLRTAEEPKYCYYGGPGVSEKEKEISIAQAWANFKKRNCAGIWEKGELQPEKRSNAGAGAGGE